MTPLPAPTAPAAPSDPPRIVQPEFIEVIVLGNNAASVFDFALAWARAKGWDMEGQDRVTRIVVSMAGPPIINEEPRPTYWWSDIAEPKSPAERVTLYPKLPSVNVYVTHSAGTEPTPAELAATLTGRPPLLAGASVQVWHAPKKDSTLICVYDGVLVNPPNTTVLWVKGEQMQKLPPLPV